MPMLSFNCPILLVRMGAGYMVANANFGQEAMKSLVFTSLVRLDCYDFSIKDAFHQVLKLHKFLKNLRLEF
jgi:hypothetical protein